MEIAVKGDFTGSSDGNILDSDTPVTDLLLRPSGRS
jgi:hypothetical protein